MAKLAYYASRIAPDKPHQLETPEGYRIYTNVPICRTGFQEYRGSEIKGHPDYDPAWGIKDNEIVKVFRPLEVVTAPETVASFEGKSVLDGHPPKDVSLVLVDNENEYGKGHMQNVRVGPVFEDGEAAGETPLLADLWVKNQHLNDKIDGGIRDVSCGYVYGLERTDKGTIAMTRICGNHVAVVPLGRAGPEVSIQDAAPVVEEVRPKPEKEKSMAESKNHFWGRMLKRLAASDADPEDVEKMAKMAKDSEEPDSEKKEERKEREDGEVELHPALKQHIDDCKTCFDAIMQHIGVGKEKKEEKPATEETTGDADVLEMTGPEQGATELPKQIAAADSAEALTALRPAVVAAKDKKLNKVFNDRVRAIKAEAAAQDSVYAGLANTATPHEEKVDDVDPWTFFNGVPYAEGKRKYDEHKANLKKGGK